MANKHLVEIPDIYLLTIAVHGNMGDGELPDLMRVWATRLCRELGLEKELHQMQDERHAELRKRLQNALGERFVSDVEGVVEATMRKVLS